MHLHVQPHACPVHGMRAHKPCWERSGTCKSLHGVGLRCRGIACQGRGWESEFHHSCRRMCRWQLRNRGTVSCLPVSGSSSGGPGWLPNSHSGFQPGSECESPGCEANRSKRKGHCNICVSSYQTVFFPGINDSVWKAVQREKQKPQFKLVLSGKQELLNCLLPLNVSVNAFLLLIHPL